MCSFNPLKTIHSGFKHSHYGSSPGAKALQVDCESALRADVVVTPWSPRTGPLGTGGSARRSNTETRLMILAAMAATAALDHSDQLLQEGLHIFRLKTTIDTKT